MAIEPVARARGLLGCAFRLHGRDTASGLDCVGVIACAFGIDGAPRGYAVRTADAARIADLLKGFGFVVVDRAEAGDVALSRPGPAQCHLSVLTPAGFVHADAGLGRVVETPGRPANMIGAWRWRP